MSVLAGYFFGHYYFRIVTRSSCSSEVFVLVLSTHVSSSQARWTSVCFAVRYSRSRLLSIQTSAAFGRWKFVRVQARRHSALWRRGSVRRRNSCTSHFCGGGRAVYHIFGFNPLFDGYVVVDVLEDMTQQSGREDDATRGFVSFHLQGWYLLGSSASLTGSTPLLLSASL